MSWDTLKERARVLLEQADIRLNGSRPADLQVHDERPYARVFAHGSLGLGDSYMDGWWNADDLPAPCTRLLTAGLDQELKTLDTLLAHLKAHFLNLPPSYDERFRRICAITWPYPPQYSAAAATGYGSSR